MRGRASTAVAEAKRTGGESAAPYEYTSAVTYLDKAREEGDQAEYQVAIEFGRRSEEFAVRARAISLGRATPAAGGLRPGDVTERDDVPIDSPETRGRASSPPKASP